MFTRQPSPTIKMMLRKLIRGSAKPLLRKIIPNLLITRKTQIRHIFPMTYRHERKLKKRKIFRVACGKPTSNYCRFCLTLSRRRPLSYRKQSIKSIIQRNVYVYGGSKQIEESYNDSTQAVDFFPWWQKVGWINDFYDILTLVLFYQLTSF